MARVEISEDVLAVRPFNKSVRAVEGAEVQVNVRDGGAATVYADATGGTTRDNPLTTDSTGRIQGWLEPGSYDLVVTYDSGAEEVTRTYRYEAALGVPDNGVDPPRIVDGGDLGDTYTLDLEEDLDVWLTATMTDDCTIELENVVAGAEVKLQLDWDPSPPPGYTLSVLYNGVTQEVLVPTDDADVNSVEIGISSPDGVDLWVAEPPEPPAPAVEALPWTIDINPLLAPAAQTNWSSILTSAGYVGGRYSSGAQNDSIEWDVLLAAGTWTFSLLHHKVTGRGIYTVKFDGTSVGTIDGYAASDGVVPADSITGIAVPVTKVVRVKLQMATKNASASSYHGDILALGFRRTA